MNYKVDSTARCIVCRTLNPGARCRGCGRTQQVAQAKPAPKRVVVDGQVYDADKVPVGVSGGTVAAVSTSSAAPLAETAVGGVQPSEAHSEFDTSGMPMYFATEKGVLELSESGKPILMMGAVRPAASGSLPGSDAELSHAAGGSAPVPRETICACGWTVPAESKAPKTAMAAHRSHSKLHK